ncbi:MAG: FeoA family protein [Candidatus Heimdallarchaeaceae archaeon]
MSNKNLLADSAVNSIVQIKKINSGQKARRFLADLGVLEGVKLRIIKNDIGPILVEVKATRIAIGRGIAQKIEVTG